MTTLEFFHQYVDPACFKLAHNLTEYADIKRRADTKLIKATTFYQIYRHNVFGPDEKRLNMKDFFRLCAQYLYYDKYICEHGTEFYYLVIFNQENQMYQMTSELIDQRIQLNGPETLTDLIRIYEAVTKENL